MKRVLQVVSALGLLLTIVPSVLVFAGRISWTQHANAMLAGALLWFLTSPFWMRARGGADARS